MPWTIIFEIPFSYNEVCNSCCDRQNLKKKKKHTHTHTPKNKALKKALKLISNTCALHSVKVCIIAWGWGAQKGI